MLNHRVNKMDEFAIFAPQSSHHARVCLQKINFYDSPKFPEVTSLKIA